MAHRKISGRAPLLTHRDYSPSFCHTNKNNPDQHCRRQSPAAYQREKHMKRLLMAGAALAVALSITMSAGAQDKKTLVFVVNGASDFWKIADAGLKKAQEELP